MGGPGQVFIIIDALDECPNDNTERRDLCAVLKEMKAWATANLHTLVTSRREVDLVEALNPLSTIDPISIQGGVVKSDIRMFVQTELSNDLKLQKWPTNIRYEIEEALVKGAEGM